MPGKLDVKSTGLPCPIARESRRDLREDIVGCNLLRNGSEVGRLLNNVVQRKYGAVEGVPQNAHDRLGLHAWHLARSIGQLHEAVYNLDFVIYGSDGTVDVSPADAHAHLAQIRLYAARPRCWNATRACIKYTAREERRAHSIASLPRDAIDFARSSKHSM